LTLNRPVTIDPGAVAIDQRSKQFGGRRLGEIASQCTAMPWGRLGVVVLVAGFVTSLTDWLFAGGWIQRRWTYQEVWRRDEARAIALTAPLPFLTCAVFSYLAMRLGIHAVGSSLAKLAIAIWLVPHCR
jgi:hypothetical protein